MFKNLGVGAKIGLAFVVIVSVAIALGGSSYFNAVSNAKIFDDLGNNRLPSIQNLLKMGIDQSTIDSGENALLCRGTDVKARQETYARMDTAIKEADEAAKAYEVLPADDVESGMWKEFKTAWNAWMVDHNAYLKLCQEYDASIGDPKKADEVYAQMTKQALETNYVTFDKADELLDKLTAFNRSQGDAATKEAITYGAHTKSISLIGVIAALVLGILMAWIVSRIVNGVTGPIKQVIVGLTEGSSQVSAAAGQVAQSSQAMAGGASEQASSLEETSASLEELTSMTKQNAENATQCNSLMNETKQVVDGMGQAMTEMSSAIKDIKRSSDETAKIIKTIDEIAFQTNLLALNAAVEAARAGDAGKGFAVVAEEVRNLAQRSAEAAKQTAALLEQSQKNADNGVQVTTRVTESLQKTVASSNKAAQLVSEITAASKEQAQGIDQINIAVSQMDKVTQSNAANSEEAASASEELSAQAKELQDMVVTLAAVVGGNSSASKNEAGTARNTVMSGASVHSNGSKGRFRTVAPAIQKPALAHAAAGGKSPLPNQVIPLDDEDFKEF